MAPHAERNDIELAPTMVAVVQDAYGEAQDVLRIETVPRPTPKADEVLLEVRAVGVERGAWHLMAGVPYPVRLAGYGLRRPKDRIRGREVAATVVAIGDEVTDLAVGDDVFGIAEQCFAEYTVGTVDKLIRKPSTLTFEQAAALPISGITALQAVRDTGSVTRGQHVAVLGASGGVGTYAVQIAKALGATVTGVCSAAKVELVANIGADHVIDYTTGDIGDDNYDVIIDIGGNRTLRHLRRALAPKGTLVIVGGETDGRVLAGTDRQLRALLLSPFVPQSLRTLIASETADELNALLGFVAAGSVQPVLDRTFPLIDTAAAISHMQNGDARGKVVVTVG